MAKNENAEKISGTGSGARKGRPKKDPNAPVVPRPRYDYTKLDEAIVLTMRAGRTKPDQVLEAAREAVGPRIRASFVRARVRALAAANVRGVVELGRVQPSAIDVERLNALGGGQYDNAPTAEPVHPQAGAEVAPLAAE